MGSQRTSEKSQKLENVTFGLQIAIFLRSVTKIKKVPKCKILSSICQIFSQGLHAEILATLK